MSAAPYVFCTLFDKNYLFKGLALYRSLEKWAGDFRVFIVCMDTESHDTLTRLALPKATLVRLDEFEDEELLKAKATRSLIEYYWTCTPSLPLYVMDRCPEAEIVTYIDSDLLFFSDPAPLYEEMGSASIMIHEHRFPSRLAHFAANGIYNVGWVSFRRDQRGLACARRWREQCNEWCYYRLEDGKLGDQKYLDAWTSDFEGVHVLQHKGGGTAPWNVEQYDVRRDANGSVVIDDVPLIFYHFHGLRLFDTGAVQRAPSFYALRPVVVRLIYEPYEQAIRDARREVEQVAPGYRHGLERAGTPSAKDELLRQNAEPAVHALIPVHNRLEFTRACLSCFARQDYAHLHVTVIDDGSVDGTAEAIAAEFPDVKVLRGDGTWWWTGSMVRGVQRVLETAAPNDFVLCVNNDTTFDDDYVSTLVRLSRERPGAMIGSVLRSWVDRTLISIGPRFLWKKGFVYDLVGSVGAPEELCVPETIDTLDALSGRGTLIPVSVFREVGNYRHLLLPHYAADYEFAARAKQRGVPLVLSTRAAVYTAPDAPRSRSRPGLIESLRLLFSRRSDTNLIDQVVLFAVVGPARTRPMAMAHVLHGAYRLLRNAVGSWVLRRDVSAKGEVPMKGE